MRKPGLPCTVPNCPTPSFALGLCQKHYTRRLRHGDVHKVVVSRTRVGTFLPVCSCGDKAIARGLCRDCYNASYYAGGRTTDHMPNGKSPDQAPDAIFLSSWPANMRFTDDPQAAKPEEKLRLSSFAPPNARIGASRNV